MEMNEMGYSEEVVETPVDEVAVDEIMNDDTGAQTSDAATQSEPVIKNQADFNAALRTRLQEKEASVSRRYQNSPEYMLGQELLRERMQNGISAEQAYQQILDERVKAKAESYKQNPQNFYEDYLRSQSRQYEPQQSYDNNQSLAEQLIEAKEMGVLPEDFSPEDITPDFIADVQEFGVRGAAKIFNASHVTTDRVVSKIAANQRLPRTMKTDGANVPMPKLDIEHMSSDDFAKLDERLTEALAKGRRVRF